MSINFVIGVVCILTIVIVLGVLFHEKQEKCDIDKG